MLSTAEESSALPSSLKITPSAARESNHPRVSVSRIIPPIGLTARSKTAFASFSVEAFCRTSISKKLLRERSDRFRSWHKSRQNSVSGRAATKLPKRSPEMDSSGASLLIFLDSVLIVTSRTLENMDIGSLENSLVLPGIPKIGRSEGGGGHWQHPNQSLLLQNAEGA